MVNALTKDEARVLWTVLNSAYAPHQYAKEFKTAMVKLCNMGGNTFACRDCSAPAPHASRYGGFVCDVHKQRET